MCGGTQRGVGAQMSGGIPLGGGEQMCGGQKGGRAKPISRETKLLNRLKS